MAAIAEIVQHTGFEEISLLSLSSSDYVWVEELAEEVNRVYKDAGLSLSLPSLRIESASADLLEKDRRNAAQRLHLRARSSDRKNARYDQQVRAR